MEQKNNLNRQLPTPEIIQYGNDREEMGYQKGYLQATLDARKRRFFKEKAIRKRSDKFYDYFSDEIAKNKRK